MKKIMKKIILAVIIIITAITVVGCSYSCSTGDEAETAAIEESVKNVLNEQKKTDAEESTTYSPTESETENVNTAAIVEAVKNDLNERNERTAFSAVWCGVGLSVICLLVIATVCTVLSHL